MRKSLRNLVTLLIAVFAISAVFAACKPAAEEPAVLESLKIVSAPTRTLYVEGDTFEKAGLKVEAVFDKGDNVDVTDLLSIPATPLVAGQTAVTASYTEAGGGGGASKSIDIDVRVISGPPGDASEITNIGATGLTLTASIAATQQAADSYWYISYGDETIDIKVLVKDGDIKAGASVWSSDSIVVYLAKVERARQISEGTLRLVIPAKSLSPLMQVYTAGEWESLDAAAAAEIACAVNNKIGFDETYNENESYIDGYKINLSVPYACLNGVSAAEKNLSVLPGLINSNGTLTTEKYAGSFGAQYEKTHTYIAVTDDLDYEENYWIHYGAVWGSAGANLQAKDGWYTEDDDGVINTIKTGGADSWITDRAVWNGYADNEIYMYRNNSTRLYAEMEFNAHSSYDKESETAEGYGKFGITVTSANGAEGLFFYVDAVNKGSRTTFTGTKVGYNTKSGGGWGGTWASLASIEGGADGYTDSNYVKLGIYREGSVFALIYYRNGEAEIVGRVSSGIGADEPAYIGVSTFKVNVNVKDYMITSDTAILNSIEVSGSTLVEGFGDTAARMYTAGWKSVDSDTDGTADYAENTGGYEQAAYFGDINHVSFYAEAKLWIGATYNADSGPKAGIVLRSGTKDVLFYIDVNAARNNNWGNYVIRPVGSDWKWGEQPKTFKFLRDGSYNEQYKTLAIMKVGDAIYFFCDGAMVSYTENIFGADEIVSAGIMGFNLNMRVKDITAVTDATELAEKMADKKVGEKAAINVDGNLSDWTAEQKSNAHIMNVSGGRSVTVYAHMNTNGIYIGADAIHNTYVNVDANAWHQNTDIEFQIGNGGQRFASADGEYSRWETGGTRDVGIAKFVSEETESGPARHTIVELFIPWGMIDGYDASSPFIPLGIAWKTPGETGLVEGNEVFENGDFWFANGSAPWNRTLKITANGITKMLAADLTIDGNASDWDAGVMATKQTVTDNAGASQGNNFEVCAFMGTDGVYLYVKVTATSAINDESAFTMGEKWRNPNYEIWINENHSVIALYNGVITANGSVTQAAGMLSGDKLTLTVEIFVPYIALNISASSPSCSFRIGSNSITAEEWFMPIDPNVLITASGMPV